MKRTIIGYNVYHAADGCDEVYCGHYATLDDALESTGGGLPRSLYETANAAGHCGGMSAPDKSDEAEEPDEWFGDDGFLCAVAVYKPENLDEMCQMLVRHGDRFTGNSVDDSAQDWIDNDFSGSEADDWCSIGVWNAATAAEFRNAKLRPRHVEDAAEAMLAAEEAAWDAEDEAAAVDAADRTPCNRDSQYTDGDPIYAACNSDIDSQDIIDWHASHQDEE